MKIENFMRAFYNENQHEKITSTMKMQNVTEAIYILLASDNE